MRGKKAAINTAFNLIEEMVSIICGLILPRMILSAFGSQYNGLITSITQFLACTALLRSGVAGATRAALYKPLAEENRAEINSIVKATNIFMKKVGFILLGAILFFAGIYPFLVQNEVGWFFTFSLFVIIGASTFAESFFGITYLIVLQADQRIWVSSLLKSICSILNTVIGVCLILNGSSIHIVKLGSSFVYVAYPIILGAYVRYHYKIDTHVQPNTKAISQRWDAFWQQVAAFVMDKTDVVVLTVFTNMLEVSVYSIYNMVALGLKQGVTAFSRVEAAFGNMIAKKEELALRENVAVVETIVYGISTILYTCAAILILDFVKIYTRGVDDVNYIRPAFAYLIIMAQFFNGVRIPYQVVVQAAGHYKQTKKGAIVEPILNIGLSIIFVFKWGLVGVAIGTLAATIFRTIQYSTYMNQKLVKKTWMEMPLRVLISFVEAAVIIIIVSTLHLAAPTGYFMWFTNALLTGVICIVVVVIGSFIFFKKDTMLAIKKIWGILKRK